MDGPQGEHDFGGQFQELGHLSTYVGEQAFRRDDLPADVGHLLHQSVAPLQRPVVQFLDMIDAQGTLDHVAAFLPVGRLVAAREDRPRLVRRYQLLKNADQRPFERLDRPSEQAGFPSLPGGDERDLLRLVRCQRWLFHDLNCAVEHRGDRYWIWVRIAKLCGQFAEYDAKLAHLPPGVGAKPKCTAHCAGSKTGTATRSAYRKTCDRVARA